MDTAPAKTATEESGTGEPAGPRFEVVEEDAAPATTAAEAPGKPGAVEAAADLREAISHPNRDTRFRAIKALGRMRDAEAAPLLASAIKGEMTDEERRVLADALIAIGEPAVEPVLEVFNNRHGSVQKLAGEIVVAVGERARGPLAGALWSGRITEDEAYTALARLGGEGTAEFLLDLVRKPGRGSIQGGITEALVILDAPAVPTLREFVEKGTARQRIVAAGVLARRGDRSVMKAVTNALSDGDWEVKAKAAGVLRDIATVEELPALIEATKANDCPQSVFWALKRLARDEKSIKTLESGLLTPNGAEVARTLAGITGEKYRYVDDQGLVHDPDTRTRELQTAVEAGLVGGKRRKRFDFETGEAPGWTGGKVVKRPARGKYSLEVAPPPVTVDRLAAEVRLVSPPIGHVVGEDSWLSLRLNAPPGTQFGICIVTERGNYHRIALIMQGGWAGFACPLAGMGRSRRRCQPGETVDRIEIRAFQRRSRDVPLYVDDTIIAGGEEKTATKEEEQDEF
ncbi:MAG: HEAT repeat domain-containing protein [Planctomycetota bacterium]